jgi:hypothetical protein
VRVKGEHGVCRIALNGVHRVQVVWSSPVALKDRRTDTMHHC